MKRLITWLLLGFVAVSAGYLLYTETRSHRGEAAPGGAHAGRAAEPAGVTVYYFHGNARCSTCLKLERYARDAVQSAFARELASGRLALKVINVESPGNEHFVRDFRLTTRSLVVAGTRGGKPDWVNLDRMWSLVDDPEGFRTYVQAEVTSFLPATP